MVFVFILFSFMFLLLRGREQSAPPCPCAHWLTAACALTGDGTPGLDAVG